MQKVGEAEVLAWGGVPDILVSNEVVGHRQAPRVWLPWRRWPPGSRSVSTMRAQVPALEQVAEAANTRLSVLVEIDVGAGRCGVAPGPDAVALAQQIAASRHLMFGGLQAYQGSAQHLRRPEERAAKIRIAAEDTRRTVEQLRQQGLSCAIVGGAGTGTFDNEVASGVFTEIQCGSYCFMDADYARNLDADGAPVSLFRHALFVLATVMSAASRPGVAVVDAGHKSVAIDSGMPVVWAAPGHALRRRLGRARQAGIWRRCDRAETGRKASPGARPLRSDGRSPRLVCRRPRRSRRGTLADRGAWGRELVV